jgi:ADP-ribosylglycohydrolase
MEEKSLKPIRLKDVLLSAAIGDICGAAYEFCPEKDIYKIDLDNPLQKFTDDTVCTFACAEAILNDYKIETTLESRCKQHLNSGYGKLFWNWIISNKKEPYNSFGNGSAMRCSIAGWYANSLKEAEEIAAKTAECTHNHPDGIKGAVAIAQAIFLARCTNDKMTIREEILDKYYPEWKEKDYWSIQPSYRFDATCEGSVPVALICFLESTSFEDCLKKCIATGGDADTIAAMACPIACAFYREIPDYLIEKAKAMLPKWMLMVNDDLNRYYDYLEMKEREKYEEEYPEEETGETSGDDESEEGWTPLGQKCYIFDRESGEILQIIYGYSFPHEGERITIWNGPAENQTFENYVVKSRILGVNSQKGSCCWNLYVEHLGTSPANIAEDKTNTKD